MHWACLSFTKAYDDALIRRSLSRKTYKTQWGLVIDEVNHRSRTLSCEPYGKHHDIILLHVASVGGN
jgi:hypothetical protein